MIKTLNLLDQYTKKLTSQVADASCQDIADIVNVKDTIEESDFPKKTKSSKKCKIAMDESAETVESEDDHPQHCEVLPLRSDAP